jgi:hypothetical protein
MDERDEQAVMDALFRIDATTRQILELLLEDGDGEEAAEEDA